MALEIGSIVDGVVTGIAKFGAFVELPDKKVGLVHISEVANEYVNDVNDYLKVQDKVKVKIISVDDKGKIALSIKQTQPPVQREKKFDHPHTEHRLENREFRGPRFSQPRFHQKRGQDAKPPADYRSSRKHAPEMSFEDKLNRFLKDSDERLLDLKRNVESKRGGRGSRRSD